MFSISFSGLLLLFGARLFLGLFSPRTLTVGRILTVRTWENRILQNKASKIKAGDGDESGMFRLCLPVWVLLDFAHLCSIHNTLFREVNFPEKTESSAVQLSP